MRIEARVYVSRKPGVLDPQGKAIESSLRKLGYTGVSSVRVGKVFSVILDVDESVEGDGNQAADLRRRADTLLEEISEKLLSNPIIEDFKVEIIE